MAEIGKVRPTFDVPSRFLPFTRAHLPDFCHSHVRTFPIFGGVRAHLLSFCRPEGTHSPISPASNAVHGYVCLEQMRAVDLASPLRRARALDAHLDRETMADVLDGIGAMFGI